MKLLITAPFIAITLLLSVAASGNRCAVNVNNRALFGESDLSGSAFSWAAKLDGHRDVLTNFWGAAVPPNSAAQELLALACEDIQSVGIDVWELSEEEIKKQRQLELIRVLNVVALCSAAVRKSLLAEISICPDNKIQLETQIQLIDAFVESIPTQKALAETGALLASQEVINNFSSEQIARLTAGEGNQRLAKVESLVTYYSLLELGTTLMPQYSEEGVNEGFKDANLYGRLLLDNRWSRFLSTESLSLHTGLNIAFYSAPLAECVGSEGGEGSEGSEGGEGSDCENIPDVTSLKFTDISNTLNASFYIQPLYQLGGSPWELGGIYRSGVVSKEKEAGSNDSISGYSSYGVSIVLNEFLKSSSSNIKNGIPRFTFEMGKGNHDSFAGSGVSKKSILAAASYRVFKNQPVRVGLLVDRTEDGEEDLVALTLSYGFKASEIFSLVGQ